MLRLKIVAVLFVCFLCGLATPAFSQMTISTDTIIPTSTCPGATMIIFFTVTNANTNPGNRYYAEWSSLFGGFSNPDTVGSGIFVIGGNGFMTGTIPADAGLGIYQVRVVSSDPEVIGSPSPIPIIITVLPQAATIAADPTLVQCEGVPVTLTSGFGVGGDFLWNTGATTESITVTTPGTYSATLTFLGCENVADPYVLNMLPTPPATDISPLANGDLLAGAGTAYQWFVNGSPIPNSNGQTLTPSQTGNYSVAVTGTNGCLSPASEPVFHLLPTGNLVGSIPFIPRDTIRDLWPVEIQFGSDSVPIVIIEPPFDLGALVWPIPASEHLNIQYDTEGEELIFYIIYDAFGKEMFRSRRVHLDGAFHDQVDLRAFPAGFYSLQLYADGHLEHHGFVKTVD